MSFCVIGADTLGIDCSSLSLSSYADSGFQTHFPLKNDPIKMAKCKLRCQEHPFGFLERYDMLAYYYWRYP